MRNLALILYLLAFLVSDLIAQDSINLQGRIMNNVFDNAGFVDFSDYNPSLKMYSNFYNLVHVETGGKNKSGNFGRIQEGLNPQAFYIDLNSLTVTKKYAIWGKADYSYTVKNNMRWNGSSDFNKVYPYLIADSVLADKLLSERYNFLGGYSGKISKKMSYGLRFEYTALMEYRTHDPRPNNMSSDLKIFAGFSYLLNSNYGLGLGFGLEKYRQKNIVWYYNLIGHSPIFHFLGLGVYSPLFSLEKWRQAAFNSNSQLVSFQLCPIKNKGFAINIAAKHTDLDKKVVQNFNIFVPLCFFVENNLNLDLAYLFNKDKHKFALKFSSRFDAKTGNENLFDSYQNIISKRIAVYRNKQFVSTLSIRYQNDLTNKISLQTTPFCEHFIYNETYEYPFRNMNCTKLNSGLNNALFYNLGRNILSFNLNLAYSQKLKSNLILNGEIQDNILNLLEGNYNYLIATGLNSEINFTWYFSYSNKFSYFLNLNWQNFNYSRNNLLSNFYNVSLGLNL